jgi:hypothetical protein
MSVGVRTADQISPGARILGLGTRLKHLIDLARYFYTSRRYVTLTTAGLAIGSGSKKKVLIASTVKYFNGGAVKSKTTVEVDFTATTHDIAADAGAAQERWYLVALAADGTPSITAGVQGAVGAGTYPATPSGETPIGLVRLEIAAGGTIFDATTDELDEAHITDEYFNFVGHYNPGDLTTQPAAFGAG